MEEKEEQEKQNDNEVTEEIKVEEVKTEEAKPAEPSYTDALLDVKKEYESKIAKLNEEHNKQIKERDNVIKQLLNDENTAPVETVADKINKKRVFKKW